MNTHSFRIKPGQDLRREIQAVVEAQEIQAGVILSGVGGLSEINFRMPGGKDFLVKEADFEIVSLTGTISTNGTHLHISASDHSGNTVGGHLGEGNLVRNTAEVVLGVVDATYTRQEDPTTGYKELVVEDEK